MELLSVSEGNYNTNETTQKFSKAMNLRFHFKLEDRSYEMAIKQVNSSSINLYCTVSHSHKFRNLGKYYQYVHQNHNLPKRRKITTERFQKYETLCNSFTALTVSQKREKIFYYLRAFSKIDKVDIEVESESETEIEFESE